MTGTTDFSSDGRLALAGEPAASVVFLGRGGSKPGLLMVGNSPSDSEPLEIVQFAAGHSVYGATVAPDGRHLAAATRMGLLWVCELHDGRAVPRSEPTFEMFHTPGVSSLAFCTGDLLASGGVDGTIKFWSVAQKQLVAEIPAHAGAVLSMCRIGSLLLATLGIDRMVRIWDLDLLDAKFTCDGVDLPKVGALASLRYDPFTGLLVHPSACGALHVYAMKHDISKRVLPAHQGQFYAIAGNGDRLATGGADDGVLKIWSAELERVELEERTGDGIMSLAWLGDHEIMAVSARGNARIWKLERKLVAGPPLPLEDLRVCTGLPLEVLAASRARARAESRTAAIAEARHLLTQTDAEGKRRFDLLTERLHSHGCRVEACFLSAERARAQNQPLDELESLLTLRELLGDVPACVPTLFAMADVLTRLGEPGLAAKALQQLLAIEPDLAEAKQRLGALQSAPIPDVPPQEWVMGDLSTPERIEAELRKCTLLGRRFSSPVVLEVIRPVRCELGVDCDELAAELVAPFDRLLPGQQHLEVCALQLARDDSVHHGQWVRVRATQEPVSIGIEPRRLTAGVDVVVFVMFEPRLHASLPGGAREHNEAVARAIVAARADRSSADWVAKANGIVRGILRRLRDRAAASTAEGLF